MCPFFKQYNIKTFTYLRYFKDGSAFICISHRDLYQHHLTQEYLLTPNIKESYSKKFHYFVMQGLNDGFDQAAFDYQSFFEVSNPVYLFEMYDDYFDLFTFSAIENDLSSINYFSNNIPVLESFKFYFKEKAVSLIKNSNINRILLPEHMRPSIHGWDKLSTVGRDEDKIIPEKCALKLPNISLTSREVEVIHYITNGFTCKETAKMIGLSHRTIETHWQNIKNKLNCQKKHEIITIAKKLELV